VFILHETDGGEATRFYSADDLKHLRERTLLLQSEWEKGSRTDRSNADVLATMDATCALLYGESGHRFKIPTRSSAHITMPVKAGHITIFRADMFHSGGLMDISKGGMDRIVTFGLFGEKHFMNETIGDTTFPVYLAAAHTYGCHDKRYFMRS